ncbi:MAG: hypothetical protein E7185_00810 [Erysipelotrichaceae bacterium]|nr:hypothetical protein [Erysipelotrichaceae bacterium]
MALLHMSFTSKYLSGTTDVNVILPDLSYGQEPKDLYGSGEKYKVLWLLHGTYGDYSDWLRKSNVELYATEKKIAVVMPSALNTNYVDWGTFAMGYQAYSYFFEELMPMVYGWLPVSDRREDNFIAGLSMGGRGACVYAFSKPERFHAVYSFSASPKVLKEPDPANPFAAREYNLINNFGGMEGYLDSPLNLLKQLENGDREKLPEMYFACGDKDPIAYQDFLAFRKYAKENGIPAEFFEIPGFSHEWRFWDLCLQDALARFMPEEGKKPVFTAQNM